MKTNFLEFAKDILIEAFFQTLYMTAVATIFATIYRIYNCNNFSNN